jgi:hypothetical protein
LRERSSGGAAALDLGGEGLVDRLGDGAGVRVGSGITWSWSEASYSALSSSASRARMSSHSFSSAVMTRLFVAGSATMRVLRLPGVSASTAHCAVEHLERLLDLLRLGELEGDEVGDALAGRGLVELIHDGADLLELVGGGGDDELVLQPVVVEPLGPVLVAPRRRWRRA